LQLGLTLSCPPMVFSHLLFPCLPCLTAFSLPKSPLLILLFRFSPCPTVRLLLLLTLPQPPGLSSPSTPLWPPTASRPPLGQSLPLHLSPSPALKVLPPSLCLVSPPCSLSPGHHRPVPVPLPWKPLAPCPALPKHFPVRTRALGQANPPKNHGALSHYPCPAWGTQLQPGSGALRTLQCHLRGQALVTHRTPRPCQLCREIQNRTLFKNRIEITQHVPPVLQLEHLLRIKSHQLFKPESF